MSRKNKNKIFAVFLTIFIASVSLPLLPQANAIDESYLWNVEFASDFDTGDLSEWDSQYTTANETVTTSGSTYYGGAGSGNYSCRTATNGDGGYEAAYITKNVNDNELYVRACFRIAKEGLNETGDYIQLIRLRNGTNTIAGAGVRVTSSGTFWWMESRSGTSWVEDVTQSVVINTSTWYQIELYWKKGSTNGEVRMWVNEDLKYERINRDTDNYGGCTLVQIGMPVTYSVTASTVYADTAVISSTYIGDRVYVWNEWYTTEEVNNQFMALWDSTSNTYATIGNTTNGEPIYAFTCGTSGQPVLVIDAQMHGNEDFGSVAMYYFAEWLLGGSTDANYILDNLQIVFIPVICGDIDERCNVNDVNINRNFDANWVYAENGTDQYSGPFAASEVETQVMQDYLNGIVPKYYMNLHQGDEVLYYSGYSDSTLRTNVLNEYVSRGGTVTREASYGSGYGITYATRTSGSDMAVLYEVNTSTKHNAVNYDDLEINVLAELQDLVYAMAYYA